jgi:hypothetical protein
VLVRRFAGCAHELDVEDGDVVDDDHGLPSGFESV